MLAPHRSFSQLCHVLLRLCAPRHPPCALSSLTITFALAPLWLSNALLQDYYSTFAKLNFSEFAFSTISISLTTTLKEVLCIIIANNANMSCYQIRRILFAYSIVKELEKLKKMRALLAISSTIIFSILLLLQTCEA